VSTTQQATEGVGLDAQEAKCREHADRLGLPVLGVFRDEGVSGKDTVEDRPGLQAAIAAVQAHPGSVLVAYSVSRVARRQKVLWGILDDRDGLGIPFSSATENFDTATPMGRAMLGMIAVWSTLEADLVSERTRDALAAVRAKGKRLGAPSMLERVDSETGERRMDPGKVELVRRVQQMAAETGLSLRRLAERLNREGVPSVKGGRWHVRTVRLALAYRFVPPAA
jgi:site-specific DNA recombinase